MTARHGFLPKTTQSVPWDHALKEVKLAISESKKTYPIGRPKHIFLKYDWIKKNAKTKVRSSFLFSFPFFPPRAARKKARNHFDFQARHALSLKAKQSIGPTSRQPKPQQVTLSPPEVDAPQWDSTAPEGDTGLRQVLKPYRLPLISDLFNPFTFLSFPFLSFFFLDHPPLSFPSFFHLDPDVRG